MGVKIRKILTSWVWKLVQKFKKMGAKNAHFPSQSTEIGQTNTKFAHQFRSGTDENGKRARWQFDLHWSNEICNPI